MPFREAIIEDTFPLPHRGVIVAVLPIGATWPTFSDRGMDLELWIGSDVGLPMTFAVFETICPMNAPCQSPYSLGEITELIRSNPGAELHLRQ